MAERCTESSGSATSESYEVSEKLSVNSAVQSGELVVKWGYSSLHYEESSIVELAAAYLGRLEELISHCLEQEEQSGQVYTPADYGLGAEISYSELDAFMDEAYNGKKRKDR